MTCIGEAPSMLGARVRQLRAAINWAVASILLSAASAQAQPPEAAGTEPTIALEEVANWFLRLPADEHVVFRGVVSFDKAGAGQSGMMYPAPNAAGFLAAVLTHGLITESVKQGQKAKMQSEADQVLSPYQEILGQYSSRELMQRGLEKTHVGKNKQLLDVQVVPKGEWLVVSTPVFFMTQDQKAIVLDNTVAISKPGSPEVTTSQKTIRVVSVARPEEDLQRFWAANRGEQIKEETAGLLAESLQIAWTDVVGGLGAGADTYRTVRYFEGSVEKMERAQVLVDHCDRLVVKTLRGSLMSVPAVCKQ